MVLKRGALIVIEGVDRTGKTTQCNKIVESLKNKNINAEYKNFPNRTTEIGNVINSYLKSMNELSDEAIHLLFSANRWENANYIIKMLKAGTTIIVDRYCYSGVAFSAAKGLDVNWCKAPDSGLPKPDKVFFLNLPLEAVQRRNGFGNERYEVFDFQKKVFDAYMQLKEENWEILDASRSMDTIQEELMQKTLSVIEDVKNSPIGKIWV
ncbi:thymidylate kinase [Melitaea cinxia]|uniref:thymidylate kinase n=1 Tax=Melitaea cinxia TaxID=113334 RepID=UPI001E271240|nr:thymidylate kinase [Melitaea cinxia]XP_045448446.1 thymidylate kinase [Melitaea cinxia]